MESCSCRTLNVRVLSDCAQIECGHKVLSAGCLPERKEQQQGTLRRQLKAATSCTDVETWLHATLSADPASGVNALRRARIA